MKSLSMCLSLLVMVLVSGPVYADCGKSHGKSNPHGRISSTGFEDMDTDKNGGVNFEEFKQVFPRTTQAGFNILDKDKNAQLNESEWDAFKDAHKGMGRYSQPPETT